MEDAPLLVSIPEARDKLGGIGHTTVYDLVNRGLITKVSIGRRSFITARSLNDYVNSLSQSAAKYG